MPRPADTFSSNYGLATLQEYMREGWQGIAALAEGLKVSSGLGEEWLGWKKSRDPKKTFCRAAEILFRDVLKFGVADHLVTMVVTDSGKPVGQWYDTALPIWRALAEVVVTGRTRDAMADFCSARWPKSMPKSIYSREWSDPNWNPHAIRCCEVLLRAFDEPLHLGELYWRVVAYACLEEFVGELDALDKKLQRGECFTSEDQELINRYTSYGSPIFRRREEEDGSFAVRRHYELLLDDCPAMSYEGVAIALLVAPAYDLGERWLNSQPWPRYETTCRAPSCGRRFYSGRRTAANCPPAQRGDACRKEWHRYMRWLKKQRLDAETKWAVKSLQQQFSKQDESRTEIRDEQINRAHGIDVR